MSDHSFELWHNKETSWNCICFHWHSRWLYFQQHSSSSSSERFIECSKKTLAGRRTIIIHLIWIHLILGVSDTFAFALSPKSGTKEVLWASTHRASLSMARQTTLFFSFYEHCQQCNDTHTNDFLLFCPGTWGCSFSACNTFWMCSNFGLLLNRCWCWLSLC